MIIQYPTHFWISAKSLENGCFPGENLSSLIYPMYNGII